MRKAQSRESKSAFPALSFGGRVVKYPASAEMAEAGAFKTAMLFLSYTGAANRRFRDDPGQFPA